VVLESINCIEQIPRGWRRSIPLSLIRCRTCTSEYTTVGSCPHKKLDRLNFLISSRTVRASPPTMNPRRKSGSFSSYHNSNVMGRRVCFASP
jgi:hypothetical protein